ncbi:MAG: hypothetical protein H0W75_11300 [Chitinophagaceae bacterium]|nr:hypothetical protein [Chitinophagaceae bacterium]
MKILILTILLTFFNFSYCFSQFTITKKDKTISLDTNRVWGIQTNSVLLLSIFDYKYYNKKQKYKSYSKFKLDTIKAMTKIGDTLKFGVTVVQYYRDTVTGNIYSNPQIEKEWNKGNNRSKPVLKDTTFYFAISDIRQLQVQTRQYRHGDAMGIFGMFVMGTGVTIFSIVTVLKGNPNGYYGLGLGAGMLGLTRHWIKKAKWLEDFKIGNRGWTIVAK